MKRIITEAVPEELAEQILSRLGKIVEARGRDYVIWLSDDLVLEISTVLWQRRVAPSSQEVWGG